MLILGDERGCVAVVMVHRFTACGGSGLSTKLPILVYSLLVRALARTSAFICASSPVEFVCVGTDNNNSEYEASFPDCPLKKREVYSH